MTSQNDKPISRTQIRLVTFVLLFVFAVGYTAYDVMIAYPKTKHTGDGIDVPVEIKRGISPDGLVAELAKAQVISSPGKFGLWLKLTGDFTKVRAGEFLLNDQMTPAEIIRALQGKGVNKGVRVTIPEGFTLSQIAAALANAGLVTVDEFRTAAFNPALLKRLGIPGPGAEGFLFPDTYFFNPQTTAAQIVERMFQNFVEKTRVLGLEKKTPKALLEVVTLASIVQSEARVAEEAPVIAGVYTNRLEAQKFPSRRLQADPTVAYGCNRFLASRPPSCSTFNGVLGSRQLLDDDNVYNTYRHEGLPPGPICAPGLHALKAALAPASVPYLYFVVSKDGRHTFSTTLADHEAAVKAYRQSGGQ